MEYDAKRILPEVPKSFVGQTLSDAEQYANNMAKGGWRLHSMALDAEGGTLVVMERERGAGTN